jgi:hypothetical protein
MQETVSASLQQMSEMAAPKNVPSLDEVRDKIERRYSVALGQAELAQSTIGGRMLDVKRATIDLKGSSRLEEIRASLAAEKQGALGGAGPSGPAAVEAAPAGTAPVPPDLTKPQATPETPAQ